MESISIVFANLIRLTFLDIFENKFDGKIPIALTMLIQMIFQYLSTNKLTNIPDALANLTLLTYLSVSRNKLTG